MYETRAKILPLKEWFTLFFAAWLMLWFTVFPPINLNRNLNFPTHYLSDNIDKSAAMTLITRGFGKNGQGVPNDGFKGLGGSLNGLIPAKAFSGNGILDITYFSQDWLVQPIINAGGTTDEAFEAISDAKYATKGGVCSFDGATLVLTKDGMLPISDLNTNMSVWSRDATTGAMDWKRVLAQYSNPYDETVSVTIRDIEGGAEQTIISNRIHPYFVQTTRKVSNSEGHVYKGAIENGRWIDAGELQAGDRLLNDDNSWAEVIGVKIEAKPLTAYNLNVEGFHTYFVAANENAAPVWVHNKCFDDIDFNDPNTKLKRTENGRNVYEIKDPDTGEIREVYQGQDGRYYDINDHPMDGAGNTTNMETNGSAGVSGSGNVNSITLATNTGLPDTPNMANADTWPDPPINGQTTIGTPSRARPANRGEQSVFDENGGEWRPQGTDQYHDTPHWNYKPSGNNTPWLNVNQNGVVMNGPHAGKYIDELDF